MLISNIVMDFEVAKKRKKTRRGKRCGRGRKVSREGSGQNCKENNGNFQLFQNNKYQYDSNIAANESGMDQLMSKIIRDKAAEVSVSNQRTSRPRYFKKSTNFIRPSSPKAPHNSTQYLMEEHEDNQTFQFTGDQSFYSPNRQADYNYKLSVSPSLVSDEIICDAINNNDQNFDLCQSFEMDCSFSDVDSVAFMMNDFDQMYDSIRAEQLSGLSKPELINAVKNLENEVTIKERRLFSSPVKSRGCTPKKSKSSIKSDMIELLSELDKLKYENIQMKKQIDELQLIL